MCNTDWKYKRQAMTAAKHSWVMEMQLYHELKKVIP